MADGGYTILHRKDEHGVIVESGVFGPDDEVPEGFGAVEFVSVRSEIRVSTIAESVLTPWESPVSVNWIGETNEAVEEAVEDVEDDESDDDAVQPPPKGGAGSGVEAWAAYAAAKDVEVPEGATRDDIIAACEAAGVPVD